MVHFLRGTFVTLGTVIATAILFEVKARSFGGSEVGVDIRVLWVWRVNSPVYWITVLALLGTSVWLFKSWVFGN